MARRDKLRAAFKACTGEFRWHDFEQVLFDLGYEAVASRGSGGSRRRYHHAATGDVLMADEPHNGRMGLGMVRRLRKHLESRGLL